MIQPSGSSVTSKMLTGRHALYLGADGMQGLALRLSASCTIRKLHLNSSGETIEISENTVTACAYHKLEL
jgi:hypothetical protein